MKIRRADFWMDDWFAGTIGLTHFERSVYITICASNWSHGCPALKDDIRNLAPGRGFDQGWNGLERKGKIIVVIDTNSTRTLHFAYNPRALEEHEKSMRRLQRSHEAGAKGGRPKRISNGLDKPEGFDTGNPRARVLQQPSPTTTIDNINGRESPVVNALEEKFAEFWSQYPSRKPHDNPRLPALKKFRSKTTGKNRADPDDIIRGARLYAEQRAAAATEPQWIKTAVVWLNQDGWKDAIEVGEVELDDEDSRWLRRRDAEHEQWRARMTKFLEDGSWDVEEWGAKPGVKPIPRITKTCDCPQKIIEEFGIVPRFHDDGIDDAEPPPLPVPAEADEPEFGF